ncbi:MAG: tetratricopeptide repeat protein [Archangium sp.]|nr:tetratricopeptide repeat protein [Archangium sp.]
MTPAFLLALALAADAGLNEPADVQLPELKGEAKARIQNIDQLLDDWDAEGAKAELVELERIAPHDVEPVRYYRGRIAFEEGDYALAIDELTRAGVGDKPGSWLRLAKDTQRIVEKHERHESAHFILLTPPGKDAVLVPWALDALEDIRTALMHDLGYAPPGKIRVEIINNASELSKVSTLSKEAIRTTGTIAICKFNKLMVTSPKAVVHGYDWLDTLAHEYTHLVVSRKSRNTVPIWMHEGLAKYLESRWRGPAGGAMTPSTLALLGSRVRKNALVPFEKMHPSMALLPTAEDAATAFAEVFFAIQLIRSEHGDDALERLLTAMSQGLSDRAAVERVTGKKWPEFEKGWMAFLKKQPYPKELIPTSSNEKKELAAENGAKKAKAQREISFGDFAEVKEPDARRAAHLGEVLRERNRIPAALTYYERAWGVVGARYESISNKYALTLMEVGRLDEALKVLKSALESHPGSAGTNVHLGRIALRKKDWALARTAYTDALAVNPFDPEVSVGLLKVGRAMSDATLAERGLSNVRLLLSLTEHEATLLAQRFGSTGDLVGDDLEAGPTSTAVDAGTADGG